MTANARSPTVRRPLLLGLIGTGIQLSRTPAMHMQEGHNSRQPPPLAAPAPNRIKEAQRRNFHGHQIRPSP